jgi:hypothetical protein
MTNPNAKLITTIIHETLNEKYMITYSRKQPKDTDPIIIFIIRRNDSSMEIIATGIPSSAWEALSIATITPGKIFQWNGNEKSGLKIYAYDGQVMLIYGDNNQIQLKLPPLVGKWFQIAHNIVGEWEKLGL